MQIAELQNQGYQLVVDEISTAAGNKRIIYVFSLVRPVSLVFEATISKNVISATREP